jgi:hypothetical protein
MIADPEFAEFISGDSARQDLISNLIGKAERQLPQLIWTDEWELGIYYRVAHQLTMMVGNGIPGQLSSVSVSQTSQSLGFKPLDPKLRNQYWLLSKWGVEYLRLKSLLPVTAFVA